MSGSAPIDYDYAKSISQKAIDAMAKHAVSATPDNFKLWYTYCQGASADLKRAIDVIISNKLPFNDQISRDLIATYVDFTSSADLLDRSEKLKTIVAGAEVFLAAAAADNRAHMRALSGMTADADPVVLIKSLMDEVAKASTRAAALEKNLASTSLELTSMRQSLAKAEEQSKTDMLTGLANRRAMDEFLRSEQIAAMERGRNLSLMLIDIDHFKSFNDTYGHSVGDQVLKLVGSSLKQQVRPDDLAARYGGEELVAILPDSDLDACFQAAERIRQVISECKIKRRSTGEQLSGITVSIGVAQFKAGENVGELIERCDRALYAAKKSGRNRVMRETELAA